MTIRNKLSDDTFQSPNFIALTRSKNRNKHKLLHFGSPQKLISYQIHGRNGQRIICVKIRSQMNGRLLTRQGRHPYVIYKRTWYYGDYERQATTCCFIINYILKWSHKLANRAEDCSARTHTLVLIIRTLHPYNCKCNIFLNARNKK